MTTEKNVKCRRAFSCGNGEGNTTVWQTAQGWQYIK